jgi:hypothetical protein
VIEVVAATEIAASAETVWRILTDLAEYPAWNPFIRHARGSLEVGGSVRVRVRPSLRIPLVFHATVLDRDEQRVLRWQGHVGSPWFASGDHVFVIEPVGRHHVRFEQRERFDGVLPRLASRLLEREARRGFEAMNRALAGRAQHADAALARAS